MTKLEELLKETEYSNEEWNTYLKVQKNNQLEDLQFILNEMLENEEISQEQYDEAVEETKWIIEKYNEWVDYDCSLTMKDAIRDAITD